MIGKEKLRNLKEFYKKNWREQFSLFLACHLSLIVIILLVSIYSFSIRAPENYKPGMLFSLEKGRTLNETSIFLKEGGIIRSSFWFKNIVVFLGGENDIKAGDYFFETPLSSYEIARRVIKGDFGLTPIKTTIPEGLNIFEIAELLENKFPELDKKEFLKLAKNKEGYLFPDTYFFMPNTKAKDFVEAMEQNFERKIADIQKDIEKSGRTPEEVIIMASIVETEARVSEQRQTIAGILWKRLEIDMPLQVDAVFKYINGKNSYELTLEDLKTDSPYNTYTRIGLPPTPIANPGLDAILATIKPVESTYFYFLADKRGGIYYAKTYDEHVENKRKYLNLQ